MSENNFTFDDETKDVLETPKKTSKTTKKTTKKKQGRPLKQTNKKTRPVACYLTEEEHERFVEFLDDRSASLFLRKLLLQAMEKEK